jgi:hypothetical protein
MRSHQHIDLIKKSESFIFTPVLSGSFLIVALESSKTRIDKKCDRVSPCRTSLPNEKKSKTCPLLGKRYIYHSKRVLTIFEEMDQNHKIAKFFQ